MFTRRRKIVRAFHLIVEYVCNENPHSSLCTYSEKQLGELQYRWCWLLLIRSVAVCRLTGSFAQEDRFTNQLLETLLDSEMETEIAALWTNIQPLE